MPWARLDDSFFANKKTIKVGLLARGLWVTALSFCSFNLTDGLLTYQEIEFLCGKQDPTALIQELLDAKLFEVVDGGYLMHDYLDYNPSRAQVLTEREQARKRMGKRHQPKAQAEQVSPEIRPKETGNSPEPNLPHTHTHTQGPPLPAAGEGAAEVNPGKRKQPVTTLAASNPMPPDHPIAIYCELTKNSPERVEPISADLMATRVRDPALWRCVVTEWLLRGEWHKDVSGMLGWYDQGGPPARAPARPAGRGNGKNGRGATRVLVEKPQEEKAWGQW